jgi:hypothetical protein
MIDFSVRAPCASRNSIGRSRRRGHFRQVQGKFRTSSGSTSRAHALHHIASASACNVAYAFTIFLCLTPCRRRRKVPCRRRTGIARHPASPHGIYLPRRESAARCAAYGRRPATPPACHPRAHPKLSPDAGRCARTPSALAGRGDPGGARRCRRSWRGG